MIKWIGQHIVDFIARFRSDVYLEDIADGTVVDNKFLGLDSNNKIVKEAASATVTDLHSAGVDGSANQLLTDDGDGTVTSESTFTYDSGTLSLSSAALGPIIKLTNSNADANPPVFEFQKTATGADGDDLGRIDFKGDDEGDGVHTYANILGEIADATPGQEAGRLSFQVAEFDGTVTTGILINGDTNSDGGVHVNIGGSGPASVTTVTGQFKCAQNTMDFFLDGETDPSFLMMSAEDTGDRFQIVTTTHGATTLTTIDDDAAAAHLAIVPDGDLTLQPYGDLYLTAKSGNIFFKDSDNLSDYLQLNIGTHGAATFTTVDAAATAAHFEIAADGNITLDAAGDIALEAGGGTVTIDSAVEISNDGGGQAPHLKLLNANADADGPFIQFFKSADGADGDSLGKIVFKGDDEGGGDASYGQIQCLIADATPGEEAGKLQLKAAQFNHTLAVGLELDGDTNVSGEVDVNIAAGAGSTTTVAGFISIGGHAVNDIDITSEFVDSDEHLMTSKAINARIAAAGGGVSVADSNTDTAFPVVFHDESNNLLDDTSGFLYNPNTGTVTIPSSLTMDGGLWSYSSGQVTMASTSSDLPVIALVNTNADAAPPVLAFQKTDTGADGDDLGSIKFTGDDDGGAVTNYCQILGEIKESANGSEEGRLSIKVADSTGLQDVIVATGLSGASIPKRHFAIPADGAGNVDGDVVYIGTGSTVAGKIYYYASNGTWQLTNSDDPSTATGWLAVALGNDPDVTGMLLRGTVDLATDIVGTEALGSIIYLDKATTGTATTAAPTATGDIVRVIGYALTTGNENKIWFSPDNTWVEHV